MKKVVLFVIAGLFAVNLFGQNPELVKILRDLVNPNIIYDPAYVSIPYPNGDIDPKKGVCTDVVIRAYRKTGIDLQKEVHEDMKANFDKYPKRWRLKEPDPNIDHRRVPNLMKFFERNGEVLKITENPEDYKPGDIVCWDLGSGILHIGIVTDIKTGTESICLKSSNFAVLHNIGYGQIAEDCLFCWKIIGHYRYLGKGKK